MSTQTEFVRAVAPTEPSPVSVDYATEIKPLLARRCVSCHGALKTEAGLRLDTGALARKGGDSGAVLIAKETSSSKLLDRVASSDSTLRMPPDGEPLTAEQIAKIRAWIATGANSPDDEVPEKDPREHWSFRAVIRPALPSPDAATPSRNPIDDFIGEYQLKHGLVSRPEATRMELVRRLYIDLIGVPPELDQLTKLETEIAEDNGYERLVDRLLDDPRHGERWARHWMDIWRYSDWWGLGEQLRNSQLHIWHWRDWIVQSLNDDVSYAEMIRQMLAADELYPNDPSKLRATGFLARNYFLFNRNQWMDEVIEHTSKGFLGLTLNCAKCHDHKYDPLPQADYYRMRAIFEPYHVRLDLVPGEVDTNRNGIPRAFDGHLELPTYVFTRGQENLPDKSQAVPPGVPEFLLNGELKIQAVQLPREAWQPARHPWVLEAYHRSAEQALEESRSKFQSVRDGAKSPDPKTKLPTAEEIRVAELAVIAAEKELRSMTLRIEAMRASWMIEDTPPEHVPPVETEQYARQDAIAAEREAMVARATHGLAAAELRLSQAAANKKEAIEKEVKKEKKALADARKIAEATILPTDTYRPLVGAKWTPTRFFNSAADDPTVELRSESTGRRTALANWIADPRNPLTARVAVNHIWARHMGTPLVDTLFDFGRNGRPPAHAELLDWLATELVENDWSMKHIHRLIVQSAAYRRTSSLVERDPNRARDPDNIGLWRRTPIRLESQVVRDSVLSLSGKLDWTMGGPSVKASEQAESLRRSIYFFHSNNDRNLFLTTFDEAMVKECYRRDQSIVPQQALALTNSRLVLDAAHAIAARLPEADDRAFIRQAFQLLLASNATELEVAACESAMAEWRKQDGVSVSSPRAFLIWALLNHNDFVTLR